MRLARVRRAPARPAAPGQVRQELRLVGQALACAMKHGPEAGLAEFLRSVSAPSSGNTSAPSSGNAGSRPDDADVIDAEYVEIRG